MKQFKISQVLFAAAIAIAVFAPTDGFALTCPQPQEAGSPGVLEETKEDIERLSAQLQRGAAGNEVSEIIFALKQKYPDVTSAEVVNYMITAYCPVVAENKDLTDEQARSKMQEFATQVRKIFAN